MLGTWSITTEPTANINIGALLQQCEKYANFWDIIL